MISDVFENKTPLESLLGQSNNLDITPEERSLARAIASTTLRRKGQIDRVLKQLMDKPLPKRSGPTPYILWIAAAQILFMDVADHAAVSLAMIIAKKDGRARHFSRLINGVLRTMARQKPELLTILEPTDILPDWLKTRWTKAYGEDACLKIAQALSCEPYLDISSKVDPAITATELDGTLLPNATIRLKNSGRVTNLPGFKEGKWWVQDVSATIAPSLFGDVSNMEIADLCAAPGGKTAYLAARGAEVSSVDISANRLMRLRENLERLGLAATIICEDIKQWQPDKQFDGVLLDAPCSATGTGRKHPDVLWLKSDDQPRQLQKIQQELVEAAVRLVKAGGIFIYCTCSLEPEEGEQIASFILEKGLPLQLDPIHDHEVNNIRELIRADGTLRSLPHFLEAGGLANKPDGVDENPILTGMDGFFVARYRKIC